ncbi:MAG: hypothetical protein ACPGXL_08050, partial [Chitinophagales bacterium]
MKHLRLTISFCLSLGLFLFFGTNVSLQAQWNPQNASDSIQMIMQDYEDFKTQQQANFNAVADDVAKLYEQYYEVLNKKGAEEQTGNLDKDLEELGSLLDDINRSQETIQNEVTSNREIIGNITDRYEISAKTQFEKN